MTYEKIGCIIDTDENYAVRLTEALNSGAFPIRLMAFTSESTMRDCMNDYDVELVLAADGLCREISVEFPEIKYITLGEYDDTDNGIICRYQSSEAIRKKLLCRYRGEKGERSERNRAELTAFYSICGDGRSTLAAMAYSYHKSRESAVLYINANEFSGMKELYGNTEKGLSDALYYYYLEKEKALEHIMGCIADINGFDCLAPVGCPDDIGESDMGALPEMLELLRNSGLYGEIVIDIGNYIRKPWNIFSESKKIVMAVPEDYIGRCRMKELEEFMERRKMTHIRERIVKLSLHNMNCEDRNVPLRDFITGRRMETMMKEI